MRERERERERSIDILTILVGDETHEACEARLCDVPELGGTTTDALDGVCDKLAVRVLDILLELAQDKGDVALGRKGGEDLELEEAHKARVCDECGAR